MYFLNTFLSRLLSSYQADFLEKWDDLVNKITQHANSSKVLFLHRNGERIKLKDNPDGDIRVSGL